MINWNEQANKEPNKFTYLTKTQASNAANSFTTHAVLSPASQVRGFKLHRNKSKRAESHWSLHRSRLALAWRASVTAKGFPRQRDAKSQNDLIFSMI